MEVVSRSDFNRRPDGKGGTYRKPATPLPPLPVSSPRALSPRARPRTAVEIVYLVNTEE